VVKIVGFIILGALLSLFVAIAIYYLFSRHERLQALEAGSQLVDTDAGPIEYRLVGESGPVILFFHGTPGGYDAPVRVYPGTRMLVPSRPGYLRTPLAAGRSPAAQAEAFAALLDALHIESVVAMGVSGGGPSAIAFAARYPDKTLGLIAVSTVSQATDIPEPLEPPFPLQSDFISWFAFSLLTGIAGPERAVRTVVPDPVNQQLILADPENAEQLVTLIWSIWPFSLRETGWRNDNQYFETMNLPTAEIAVPTLILHGTGDDNAPFSNSELLAQQIPGSVLHAVEGADHMMMLSHRREISSAITDFLRTIGVE